MKDAVNFKDFSGFLSLDGKYFCLIAQMYPLLFSFLMIRSEMQDSKSLTEAAKN